MIMMPDLRPQGDVPSTTLNLNLIVEVTRSMPSEIPAETPFANITPESKSDPFNYFLEPLLEGDRKKCEAWKDEVQNILIFAGLFSAVVTAFIIESYQQLRPDPTDAVIGLLQKIANGKTDTANGISPSFSASFAPARCSIRVNIFWFTSLVLALTVALVGIITLQWLREHQRYDNSLNPMQKFAIFNARSDGLRRWYVPHIFSALPLLLQSALILFFAGIVEFLFMLQATVAIVVSVVVGIPILFLVATTLLPTLQLYTLHFPFLLSINDNVPTPCPYKSPPSLIVRRAAVRSKLFFNWSAKVFAVIYLLVVFPRYLIAGTSTATSTVYIFCRGALIREMGSIRRSYYAAIDALPKLTQGIDQVQKTVKSVLSATKRRALPQSRRTPVFCARSRFRKDLWLDARRLRLHLHNADWILLDEAWLGARTSYHAVVSDPNPPARFTSIFRVDMHILPAVHDCVQGLQSVIDKGRVNDSRGAEAFYYCSELISSAQTEEWKKLIPTSFSMDDQQKLFMRSQCISLTRILEPTIEAGLSQLPPSLQYADASPTNELPDLGALHSACLVALNSRVLLSDRRYRPPINLFMRWNELVFKLVAPRLLRTPEIIFDRITITSRSIVPAWMASRSPHFRKMINFHLSGVSWTRGMSQRWTSVLGTIIQTMSRDSICAQNQVFSHPIPPVSEDYPDLKNLLRFILIFQVDEHITNTLVSLHNLLTAEERVPGRPFVMIIACFYIHALVKVRCHDVKEFSTLLNTVCFLCGGVDGTIYPGIYFAWAGLGDAIKWIHAHQFDLSVAEKSNASEGFPST